MGMLPLLSALGQVASLQNGDSPPELLDQGGPCSDPPGPPWLGGVPPVQPGPLGGPPAWQTTLGIHRCLHSQPIALPPGAPHVLGLGWGWVMGCPDGPDSASLSLPWGPR